MKLLAAMITAPLSRLRDISPTGWLVSLSGGLISLVRDEMFIGILLLASIASWIDYYLGVKAARFGNRYNPALAHAGAVSKVSGILQLLILRAFEEWLSVHVMHFDSRGLLASVVAMAIFAADLGSWQSHREELGARPIPVLTSLLRLVHDKSDAILSAAFGVQRDRAR